MISFVFDIPIDSILFMDTIMKDLDLLMPDCTIRIGLSENSMVTDMNVDVDDNDENRDNLKKVLEKYMFWKNLPLSGGYFMALDLPARILLAGGDGVVNLTDYFIMR